MYAYVYIIIWENVTEPIKINMWLCQGCGLSPFLFNM